MDIRRIDGFPSEEMYEISGDGTTKEVTFQTVRQVDRSTKLEIVFDKPLGKGEKARVTLGRKKISIIFGTAPAEDSKTYLILRGEKL
jgi:hypothetical protein